MPRPLPPDLNLADLDTLLPQVKPEKGISGYHARVGPAERLAIQRAYLLHPDASVMFLADKFNRRKETIRRCLSGPDYDQLVAEVHAHIQEDVHNVLRQEAVNAARKWAKTAVNVAADKGDHKPAKDLLIAGKYVDTDNAVPSIVVQVGIKLEGHPE